MKENYAVLDRNLNYGMSQLMRTKINLIKCVWILLNST